MTLTVLEFGEQLAAAYCGKLFARWGADVIRVDGLETGDTDGERGDEPAMGKATQAYLHRGKRRVGLDLGSEAGRALLNRLAERCDIVVCDGTARELEALRWSELGDGGATIVRTAITPFGFTGPYRDWQASGSVLLAMGGYTWLMGDPGRAPLTMPGHYVEYQSGQYAYIAALSTWMGIGRGASSEPQAIDVSMLETALSLSQFTTIMWTFRGQVRSRHGNDWENLHPLSLYQCSDGWFALNIVPNFWTPFTIMLGKPELTVDPRFESNQGRMDNKAELNAIIEEALGHLTMQEILDLGQRQSRVPTGIMMSLDDLLDDTHLKARNFWQHERLPSGEQVRVPASPYRYVGEAEPALEAAAPHPTTSASASDTESLLKSGS